jgi:hypothetical protein
MSLRGNLIEEVVQRLHLVFHPYVKENEKLKKKLNFEALNYMGQLNHLTTNVFSKMVGARKIFKTLITIQVHFF